VELAAELDPEAAVVFDASGEAFVSVRSEAGEDAAAGACEASLAEDFVVADFTESRDESRPDWVDESRLGEEASGLAPEEATESASVLVEAEEEGATPRLRILGSAMMEATTINPTAMGMT